MKKIHTREENSFYCKIQAFAFIGAAKRKNLNIFRFLSDNTQVGSFTEAMEKNMKKTLTFVVAASLAMPTLQKTQKFEIFPSAFAQSERGEREERGRRSGGGRTYSREEISRLSRAFDTAKRASRSAQTELNAVNARFSAAEEEAERTEREYQALRQRFNIVSDNDLPSRMSEQQQGAFRVAKSNFESSRTRLASLSAAKASAQQTLENAKADEEEADARLEVADRNSREDCTDCDNEGNRRERAERGSGESTGLQIARVIGAATPLALGGLGAYMGIRQQGRDYNNYLGSCTSLGLPCSPPQGYGGVLGNSVGAAMFGLAGMNGFGGIGYLGGGPFFGAGGGGFYPGFGGGGYGGFAAYAGFAAGGGGGFGAFPIGGGGFAAYAGIAAGGGGYPGYAGIGAFPIGGGFGAFPIVGGGGYAAYAGFAAGGIIAGSIGAPFSGGAFGGFPGGGGGFYPGGIGGFPGGGGYPGGFQFGFPGPGNPYASPFGPGGYNPNGFGGLQNYNPYYAMIQQQTQAGWGQYYQQQQQQYLQYQQIGFALQQQAGVAQQQLASATSYYNYSVSMLQQHYGAAGGVGYAGVGGGILTAAGGFRGVGGVAGLSGGFRGSVGGGVATGYGFGGGGIPGGGIPGGVGGFTGFSGGIPGAVGVVPIGGGAIGNSMFPRR
jgi:hypothetical protein